MNECFSPQHQKLENELYPVKSYICTETVHYYQHHYKAIYIYTRIDIHSIDHQAYPCTR